MRRLVILRPEPGASATAEAARRIGLTPSLVPLFEVEPVSWAAPDPAGFDGLLLTSANAVRHGGAELESLRALSVYAVGDRTATEARDAGFVVAETGAGGVDSLLESLDPDLRLLHLCGEHRRTPATAPQSVSHVAVYRARPIEQVDGLDAIAGAVVAVHSGRAGARLAELAGIDSQASAAIAAISAEAARACGNGWERVETAAEPTDCAVLALAARLCKTSD
jgi:uroporphyrinogen-III synthase